MIEPTDSPAWPTTLRSRLRDGRLMGTDGSVWLYRAVPMSPVVDAKSPSDALVASESLLGAYEELASMTSFQMARRSMARGSYRQTHMLLVNVPKLFEPDRAHPIAEYLRKNFGGIAADRRVLLFGVRLVDKVGGGSGGMKAAIDSVVETLVAGNTPLSDYDEDFARVSAAMDRAGLIEASTDDIRLANAWWNHGDHPDTPMLVHADHLHFFNSAEAVTIADKVGVTQCHTWDEAGVPGQNAVSFASVQDLDLPFIDPSSPAAAWVSDLVELGALVVSVRGNVEPGEITRQELRRQRKRYIDDITERAKSGKMERAEQQEMLGMLEGVEAMYATGGTPAPTLAGTSIVIGFDGQVGDLSQLVPSHSPAKLSLMAFRQPGALAETMLCSNMRANPNLHDLPIQTIACSGMPSLNLVGDDEGAMIGFTERDRQPAYVSPTAASTADGLPMMLVAGATGSGKALSLDTRIPTPSGWTTMGELEVGDEVLGGDGKPTKVTFTTGVQDDREVFRVTFDDGTWVLADADHQWMVTDARMRHRLEGRSGQVAVARRDQRTADIERIMALANTLADSDEATVEDLFDMVTDVMAEPHWKTWFGVLRALDFLDTPYVTKSRRDLDMSPGGRASRVYNAKVGLKSLAMRLDQSQTNRPLVERGEFRMTTGEMLDAGLTVGSDVHETSNFAIRVPRVTLPEADLPIDPYVLGAWLGDGSRSDGRIASARVESCADENGFADQDHMLDMLGRAGFAAAPLPSNPDYVVSVKGLAPLLRAHGLIDNKHVPVAYLRSSADQRLALVQGLMDTDGCITKDGEARFSQKDRGIFDAFVEVVRSLGIKVTVQRDVLLSKPYLGEDGETIRQPSGFGSVAYFTTTQRVVSIPRKVTRLRTDLPKRSSLKFVRSIERVESVPVKCITVDSLDHSYLCDEFTLTLNTMVLLNMADQFSRMGRPCIIVDPKMGSDHSAVVLAAGGQVASLDELTAADGIFDPLRFAANSAVGVELAASMLMSINPWGHQKDNMEVPLQRALAYGVQAGATCIGQALQIARENLQLPEGMVDRIFDLADSSPMFRACVGMNPGNTGLRVSNGITLIKVGDAYLDLPEPGQPATSITQRIAMALVRMMVFGSAMALTNRFGAVLLDEAWTFMAGGGRAEMERLGRLARSQQVLPIMFTQRVTDATNAGLSGYISRGLILAIEDEDEARAACELFKIEPTPDRMARITAKATKAGSSASGVAANWNSLRALKDAKTDRVLRGSVGIYSDLAGRAIPVEMTLSAEFLRLASTSPHDIARRKEAQAAQAAVQAQAAQAALTDTGPDAGGVRVEQMF